MYYLMIKEIEQTGLKYLCKRKKHDNRPDDHLEYKGSGVLWRRILNKHPEYTIKTTVLGCFEADELKRQGLYYSELYNIVESEEWANLINEIGDGGDTSNTDGFKNYYANREATPSEWRGSKTCHNPSTNVTKRLKPGEELPEGFVLGSPTGRGYGPRKGKCSVYHNGERKIYLKEGEPVPDGFIKGLHYEGTTKGRIGCHNPETNEKRYIQAGEDIPEGFVLGIKPTTGKGVLTPHGRFPSVAACMRALNLTRHEFFCKIEKQPDWSFE